MVHIMDYYSAMKKNEILSFSTTQINLRTLCLVTSVREKQICIFSFICGI